MGRKSHQSECRFQALLRLGKCAIVLASLTIVAGTAANAQNAVVWGVGEGGGSCVPPCNISAVPIPSYTYALVASGDKFCVGIDADGFLHAWGCPGWSPGPTPQGTFSRVGAGEGYYVALRSDPGQFGTVEHVGSNAFGQLNNFPVGYTFKDISVGEYHSIGIIKTSPVPGEEEDMIKQWGGVHRR